jgi:hypothetical protein
LQSGSEGPSGLVVCRRVLARTGWSGGSRALTFLLLRPYCHAAIVRGAVARRVRHDFLAVHLRALEPGNRRYVQHGSRRLATAGLQLAAAMMMCIWVNKRCTRGWLVPTLALLGAVSSYLVVRAMEVRKCSKCCQFFVNFVCVCFSCGGWCVHIF